MEVARVRHHIATHTYDHIRVRVDIIGHARIKYVGKSQSCMWVYVGTLLPIECPGTPWFALVHAGDCVKVVEELILSHHRVGARICIAVI